MAAVQSAVDAGAQVVGQKGMLVNKGDVLFEIDPRTYTASLAQAQGKLASLQARLERLDADFDRAKRLIKTQTIAQGPAASQVAIKHWGPTAAGSSTPTPRIRSRIPRRFPTLSRASSSC